MLDMLAQETALADVIGYHLRKDVGMQVGCLLGLYQPAKHSGRCNDPAQAHAW